MAIARSADFVIVTGDGLSVLRGERLERVLEADVLAVSDGCMLTEARAAADRE